MLTVFGIHFRWEIIGPVSFSARNSFVVKLCLRAPKKNMTTIFAPIAVAPNPNFKERLRATASKAGNITDKCHGNEIPWERVKATSRTYETIAIDRVCLFPR